MTRVHAMDISLNHGAVVELTDGELTGFWYYTDLAGSADRSREHGSRLKVPKEMEKERQQRQMWRLDWVATWIDARLDERTPDFAGIEDYAIRAEQGAHYLGEVGGRARLALWQRGVPFRLHDPISVKMFVAHDGTAQKDLIEEQVAERWGVEFGKFNAPPSGREKPNRATSEDLADAYGIAKLLEAEVAIRAGTLTLDKLAHDKERQVFNRVTKTYPVSLIGREWIRNPSPSISAERKIMAMLDGHELCKGVCGLKVMESALGGALPEGLVRKLKRRIGGK